MSQLAYLVHSVHSLVKAHADDEEDSQLHLTWLPSLETLLGQRNLEANWNTYASFVRDEVLTK
jgi:hypothetical protein